MFILTSSSKHTVSEDAVRFQRNKLILESYCTVLPCLGQQFCCYFAYRAFDPSGRVHCSRYGGVNITDGVLRIEAEETVNRFTLEFAN